MRDESDEETEWTRQSLLEMGVAPAITRSAVLPYTDKEPGNLVKKA